MNAHAHTSAACIATRSTLQYLVEEVVEDPGEEVVEDIVPLVRVELEEVLDDAHLETLAPLGRSVAVERGIHLSDFVFVFAVGVHAVFRKRVASDY